MMNETTTNVVLVRKKVLIAIAGGTAPNGHILTEGACRLAVEEMGKKVQPGYYTFDEMTGCLYASVVEDDQQEANKGAVGLKYPRTWLKIEDADVSSI
jgi:hypothetical protein